MTIRRLPYLTGATLAAFALLVGGSTLSPSGQAQPLANGQELFERRCGGCHSLDRDKEGPRLGGVYGRTAGTIDSFQYSDALKKSGITWNDESLDQWLTDPERVVPGNDMAFHLEKADERRQIIAYLKEKSPK
jgi:cytochrome c